MQSNNRRVVPASAQTSAERDEAEQTGVQPTYFKGNDMDQEQWFPIQGDHGSERDAEGRITRHWKRPAGRVPWAVARAAYEVYARKYGRDQSLETLAARGGFGWSELAWLLSGGSDTTEQFPLQYAEPITK